MRHVIVAIVIGVLTIGASIFILSDTPNTYETDTEDDRMIVLGERFQAQNYDMTANAFECMDFEPADEDEAAVHGCTLDTDITNTTEFEVVLGLDGDKAIASDGSEYPSSQELTTQLIPESELLNPIQPDETASGKIFFDVPPDTQIDKIETFESVTGDPITISL